MTDFALVQNGAVIDMAVVNGDILGDDGLQTAISLSLFMDRRATDDDAKLHGITHRRGNWADSIDPQRHQRGSWLWLYERATLVSRSASAISREAKRALAWMVKDGILGSVDCNVARLDNRGYTLQITITRPGSATPQSYEFVRYWETGYGY